LPPLCSSCNFEYEDTSGEAATKDFEGKDVPGDCYLLSADLEQAFLIPGTNNLTTTSSHPGTLASLPLMKIESGAGSLAVSAP
jgi:hypothetical protein